MQDIRDLECLVALARHRHFAKAAAQCGLSQPAFSMRIRALEERLDTRIVRRGNRFLGLTPEGEAVLEHATGILRQVKALEDEVRAARGEVAGSLTLGVVPTAGAFAATLARDLRMRHPQIRTRLETATALNIQQGVDEGRFDAGLTYTDGVPTDLLGVLPLYSERYDLLMPPGLAADGVTSMRWQDAARLPLILLERDMQNRRILDQAFRDAEAVPHVVAETNGFMAAVLMAAEGLGATIIPRVLRDGLGTFRDLRALPLTEPDIAKDVSLVFRKRTKGLRTLDALREMLRPPR